MFIQHFSKQTQKKIINYFSHFRNKKRIYCTDENIYNHFSNNEWVIFKLGDFGECAIYINSAVGLNWHHISTINNPTFFVPIIFREHSIYSFGSKGFRADSIGYRKPTNLELFLINLILLEYPSSTCKIEEN